MTMHLHARMIAVSVIANQVSVLAQTLLVIANSDRAAAPVPDSVCRAAAEACSLAEAAIRQASNWCDLGPAPIVRELSHAAAVLLSSQVRADQIRAATTALKRLVEWMRSAAAALDETMVQISPDEWLSAGGELFSQPTREAIARLVALGNLINAHFGNPQPAAQPS